MTTNGDDPDLNARFQARMKELATEKDLTVADRLFKRAMDQRMKVYFDADPPIAVEIRVPLSAEFDKFLLLKHELVLAGVNVDTEKQIDVSKRILKLLSTLCVDPSLNEEFFESGMFGVADALTIIEAITEEGLERIRKARNFRQRNNRKKHDATMPEDGKVSA